MHERSAIAKTGSDLGACSFQNWYKSFAKISIKSICIKIPDEVKHYLLDEIIILPKECMSSDQLNQVHEGYEDEDTENSEVCLHHQSLAKSLSFLIWSSVPATRVSRIQQIDNRKN